MALNKDTLGAALLQAQKDFKADIDAEFAALPKDAKGNPDFSKWTPAAQEALALRRWKNFADVVLSHIANNAEVTPNGTPQMAAGGDNVTGKGKIQ